MVSRRESLAALFGLPLLASSGRAAEIAPTPNTSGAITTVAEMARNFHLSGTYINAAYTHPLPLDAALAQRKFAESRIDPFAGELSARGSKALFAQLINAAPDEIALIPSTSYGESFVIGALGLKDNTARAKVVTDILHFDGSLYTYGELAKRGLGVTVLPMTAEGRIDMNRLETAVTTDTRLVAVSLVSMVNGFEHDLKAVCDIAHRKGALVYADIIQGAGAVPIDVAATGVDFMACSSFKWLMGDFGCGFLYVSQSALARLKRNEFGYHQVKTLAYHALPGDPAGSSLFESTPNDATAAGFFEVGSVGSSAEVAVSVSLQNFLTVGVANIAAARRPLVDRLRDKLDSHFQPLTPKGSTSPILAYSMPDARGLRPKLKEAGVNIQVYANRFRISPSVYNTKADIDKLIGVLTT